MITQQKNNVNNSNAFFYKNFYKGMSREEAINRVAKLAIKYTNANDADRIAMEFALNSLGKKL